ncbi:MAG TPA: peptidyl-prolyl cis-trans isomerase [Candidatus Eisenbacteria bacterium]|nr:peptidyl-prolyl cis-trans isomerase [Candidatus Eisenbacteria bacterium]
MTSSRAASLSLKASLVLAALALAGCSGGPHPEKGPGASSKASGAKVWQPGHPDTLGPVLAIVGTRRITRHEVDSLIATAPSGIQAQLREEEGYKEAVNRLVTQEIFYQAAQRARVDQDSAYQAQLRQSSKDLMLRRFYEMKLAALPPIPDSTARAYFDAHLSDYTLLPRARVRHIALPTKAKAAEVRKALVKGALWDDTALKRSTDKQTSDNGGLLGWVTKDSDMINGVGKSPGIRDAAFALPIGDVSQPIKGPKSWHLIRVDEREEATVQPFESVKDRILSRLKQERRESYGTALTDSLKQFYNVSIFDDSIKVALVPNKTAGDMFKEAQAAATPLQRIDLYRQLVKRFPADSVSVQARFMIGFTYAEELNEYDAARKEFEEFIKTYGDTELGASAKWMLDNMEKPAPPLEDDDTGKGSDKKQAPPPPAPKSGSSTRSP